jgi:hypothetical protein
MDRSRWGRNKLQNGPGPKRRFSLGTGEKIRDRFQKVRPFVLVVSCQPSLIPGIQNIFQNTG